jgi:RNA polymerase sigma-70 factor (ECF subfamily)
MEQSKEGSAALALYQEAAAGFGGAIERLARAYEADPDRRRDLLQEIHVALWRSFEVFDGRCSLRTWVYRVAHNVAISQVTRRSGRTPQLVSLDELDEPQEVHEHETVLDRQLALDRLLKLIHTLKPLERQIILLYLEGMDAAAIGEVTGISSGNVATKVHRIKNILARRFAKGTCHGE